jgi:hypothetical protein
MKYLVCFNWQRWGARSDPFGSSNGLCERYVEIEKLTEENIDKCRKDLKSKFNYQSVMFTNFIKLEE